MISTSTDLASLLAATASGDRKAFATLYEAVSAKLFALILRIVRSRALADDVLQDVFLKIWQNASSFSPKSGSPMGWMASIARHRAIDVMRRKSPETPAAEDESGRLEALADPSGRDVIAVESLRICLGRLDEAQRLCVLSAYYEGFSREELARKFDAPVGTIKTWLHRSLTALRLCLDES